MRQDRNVIEWRDFAKKKSGIGQIDRSPAEKAIEEPESQEILQVRLDQLTW
jgi:hypothetical protein